MRCLILLLIIFAGSTACGLHPETESDGGDLPVEAQSHQVRKPQMAADLESFEQRVQAAYKKISPAVVRITYGTRMNREWTLGSGVVVSSKGYVLTHSAYTSSILDDDLLRIHLPDGRHVRGKALGWSGEFGIGLLKITKKGPWPYVDFGNTLEVGQTCVALGYPNLPDVEPDRWSVLRVGTVTLSAAPIWLKCSCQLKVNGHSIFDLEGRLLGLISGYSSSRKEDQQYTSVEMIKTLWDELVAGENIDHSRLFSSEPSSSVPEATKPSDSQPVRGKEQLATVGEQAALATVRIREEGEESTWSGVIVTAVGHVITCGHHDRLPGQRLIVSLSNGRDASAVVLGTNLISDVGLIKIIDEGPWPFAPLGRSATMKLGDPCILIGYPMVVPGRQPWISEAKITKPKNTLPAKDDWSSRFWTLGDESKSIGFGGGISGGGVFDLQGRVVGAVLGGSTIIGNHQRRHARVELFHKQWDLLANSSPVQKLDSDPLDEIAIEMRRIAYELPPIAVEVLVDGEQQVLGTIVGEDGRILTKASELEGDVACRLFDGRILPANILKVSKQHDLALLKIDAKSLNKASWSLQQSIAPGTLLAALIPGKPAKTGVVSLAARLRPSVPGAIGVSWEDTEYGLVVVDDMKSQGYETSLRKGDVVFHIEGQTTPNFEAYWALFQPKSGDPLAYAGETVRVGVERGDKTLELLIKLLPSNFWNYEGNEVSRRWWDFPSVFDTDIRLTPRQCGAPLIDKSGQVVGIAIASLGERFGERLIIPAQLAKEFVQE